MYMYSLLVLLSLQINRCVSEDWLYSTCTSSPGQPCGKDNTECILGQCLCTPGYYYSVTTNTCIEQCATEYLHDTFTVYNNSGLDGYNNATFTDERSVAQCRKSCTNVPGCLSTEYRWQGKKTCNIQIVNFRDTVLENQKKGNDFGWTMYQRNCAPPPEDWLYSACTSSPGQRCWKDNAECILGQCLCTPGYYYSVTTKTCMDRCAPEHLDGTYTVYNSSGIAGYNYNYFDNASPETCRDACTRDPACQSMEFQLQDPKKCSTHRANFRDAAVHDQNKGDAPGWVMLQRNCKPSPADLLTSVAPKIPEQPCQYENTDCKLNQCFCTPGIYYSVTTKTCVEQCATENLHDTYSVYNNSGIVGHNNYSFVNKTVEECRDSCTRDSACRFMEWNGAKICKIHHVNFMDVDSQDQKKGNHFGWVMYQRDCALTPDGKAESHGTAEPFPLALAAGVLVAAVVVIIFIGVVVVVVVVKTKKRSFGSEGVHGSPPICQRRLPQGFPENNSGNEPKAGEEGEDNDKRIEENKTDQYETLRLSNVGITETYTTFPGMQR